MINFDQSPRYKTACGGFIKDPTRYPSAEFHGETIYFCTQACLAVFLKNPEPFMAGEIEHPLDEDENVGT
ncbi:MAG: YHS domain-containing protein [Chloroflexi bacterium]|nr:YHS domain-containing protein [Chloroflexota bacterium]